MEIFFQFYFYKKNVTNNRYAVVVHQSDIYCQILVYLTKPFSMFSNLTHQSIIVID